MTQRSRAASYERWSFEKWVGIALRTGVLLSLALVTAGIAWRWLATGRPEFEYEISATTVFHFWSGAAHDLMAGAVRPRLLINLGISVLLLTPFVRVAMSVWHFALVERNFKYALFTGFVFCVLGYSLFLR